MLVLSRKKGESIMIGDDIELVVLEVEGDLVKIGINAPKHVAVYRKEVYLAIRQSNEEAASLPADLGVLQEFYKKEGKKGELEEK